MKKITILFVCLLCCGYIAAQSYSLQQLKDSALRNNIAIRTAKFNIDAAQQQRKEAFTKYFPTVSGTGLWFNANHAMTKMDVNMSDYITPELGATLAQMLPVETLAALNNPVSMTMMKSGTIGSIMAMQPIFAGGQIVYGNRLAKIGEDVSQLQLQLSEKEVERTVEQYYWQLVSLQEKMRTIAAVDTLLADIYKDVDVAVRAGVAMRNDLLQVQLRQNDLASQKLKLQNGINIVKLLLAQYANLTLSPSPKGEGEAFGGEGGIYNFEVEVPNLDQQNHILPSPLPEEPVVEFLPEYRLLGKQVEATALQTKMAIGQNMPTIAVGAGYTYHNLMENDRTAAMMFATVSIPISDWWGGSHAVKRRQIEYQKAVNQLEDNAELLAIRIQNAQNGVVEAQQQLQLSQRSIEQAEENLRLNRDYYRAGTSRMADLLQAQLLYQQALDQRTDAYADYQNKLLEYRQAIGQ